jgi:hypothetical protein
LTSAGGGVYSRPYDDEFNTRFVSPPPRFRGTGARSRVIVSLPPDEPSAAPILISSAAVSLIRSS